jgi:hypothetical protein
MYSLRLLTLIYFTNIFVSFHCFQVNTSYDEYLKKFYPHQEENIHTNNNWTLSDEFVELVNANTFFSEHIRWNIKRFRPSDIISEEPSVDERIESTPDVDKQLSGDNAAEAASQQPSSSGGDTAIAVCPMSLRSKRKASANETNTEGLTSTQTRRAKRNRIE